MHVHRKNLALCRPDRSWTLFIDRDGVINRKRDHDYVKRWEEFTFIENSLLGLSVLSEIFGRMVIVTNQRGIERGLMSEEDLAEIHHRMMLQITASGGRIDGIYHCPHSPQHDLRGWRKPKPGMGYAAKADFPEIDFHHAMMIGDSISDMEFGRNLGMYTIWISNRAAQQEEIPLIDARFESLYEFGQWINRFA